MLSLLIGSYSMLLAHLFGSSNLFGSLLFRVGGLEIAWLFRAPIFPDLIIVVALCESFVRFVPLWWYP
jgi:hypothetical protein